MKKTQQKRPMYFNADNFVNSLLKALKMDKSDPAIVDDLKKEIALTLAERVNAVVISSMGSNELFLLQKTMEDHPELDEIDCLSIITPYIPDLDQRILKAVDDLYEEILENVRRINMPSKQ